MEHGTHTQDNHAALWHGRFAEGPDAEAVAFETSIHVDERMALDDIKGSRAHAAMLGHAGIISKEEAEKIVEGLTKGIRTFHEELTEALKNSGVNYVEKLQELGQDLSNEQRYEIYINFLSMLIVLDVQNFNEEKASQIEDFQTIKGRFAVNGEVTEEMLDDVIEKIASALKDNTFCLTTTETVGALFEKIQENRHSELVSESHKKQKPLAPIIDEEKPFAIPDSWKWVRLDNM